MLRAIMAVSADGFVCTGEDDDMRWTGKADKRLFREQTEGCAIGAGTTTWQSMRGLKLPGRTLVRITREPGDLASSGGLTEELEMTLGGFAEHYPDGWLIGGQTVLLSAIQEGFVDRVVLSHVEAELGEGVKDQVSPLLHEMGWAMRFFPMGEVKLVTWNRGS